MQSAFDTHALFPSGMTWSGLPVSDAVRRGQHRFVRVRLSLYRANSAAPSALKRCRQCRPGRPQSTLQRRFLVSIDLISSFVVGISGGEILNARKPISSSVGITLGRETRLKRGYSTSASSRCLSSTSPAADDYGDGHHMFPSLLDDGQPGCPPRC